MFPDAHQAFRLEADSSTLPLTVLSNSHLWTTVASDWLLFQKGLSVVERNYENPRREMLAIIRAWKTGAILGSAHHKFEIWRTQEPGVLLTAKKLNRRQLGGPLPFQVRFCHAHRPGCSMGKSVLVSQGDHGTGGEITAMLPTRPEFFAAHAVRALSGLSPEERNGYSP